MAQLRTGKTLRSCTMLMPVLLAEKNFEPWLGGDVGIELLKLAPNDVLQATHQST
jgi:hypothetical protein